MPPDLDTLPYRVNRRVGADLVTRYFFPVSHRSLERWNLVWRIVNNQAITETSALFVEAGRMLDAAPPIRSGRTVKFGASLPRPESVRND